MIESISDNPPAFPGGVVPGPDYHAPLSPGMTLRDWFAGQTLVEAHRMWGPGAPDLVAAEAYKIADAMLRERAREETK